MRKYNITTQPQETSSLKDIENYDIEHERPFELGGWLDGKNSYLWFGIGNVCIGWLEGHKLYRLAKAIVRQYESVEE